MIYPTRTLTEHDLWRLKQYMQLGYTMGTMQSKLGVSRVSIERGMRRIGKVKRLVESDAPKETANMHNQFGDYGKVNPFEYARNVAFPDRFYTFQGAEYYQGRLIRGMKDWHKIIRDVNQYRKDNGLPQFDSLPDWLV